MRGIGAAVWTLLASGAVALCLSAFARVVPEPSLRTRPGKGTPMSSLERYRAESLGSVVQRRDLFQVGRRPADVSYDPARGSAQLPDGPPKPQLVLTGVVWGDVPEAVIEGLPTASGPRVVRVGDVVGGVTVKRIDQSRLLATGFDTTWTLTVRVPWK